MSSASTTITEATLWDRDWANACVSGVRLRLREYVAIAKPKIAVMILVTVWVGYFLASRGNFEWRTFWSAALGIVLAATASSALNQYLERDTDAKMARTRQRALPAKRLQPAEVLVAGLGLSVLSTGFLFARVNATTALLTLGSIVLYAGIYTPLKRRTAFCTTVGAVPGALPPVLGWTAAGTPLDATAFALFAVVFLWQFPHFLAIAWLYREQYSQAGLKMLPAGGDRRVTGMMAVTYALCLIPVGLIPTFSGSAGAAAGVMAVLLGGLYLAAAAWFLWDQSRASARWLLWVSLVYLPTVLLSVTVEHWRLLS